MNFIKAPITRFNLVRKRNQLAIKRQMLRLKKALSQETTETKEMLLIYRKYTMRQASKEEMKIANHQFFDVVKGLGIGIFAILPFAPITIPIMIKIGKWVGVDILPSSFNEIAEDIEEALTTSDKTEASTTPTTTTTNQPNDKHKANTSTTKF